jgi:hypothetical protein
VVTEDGPHPTLKVEPTTQPDTRAILAGRATSVPFTAVMTGPPRTTTDNHEAASTSAVPRPRRSQQRPNWLWEQGVADVASPVNPASATRHGCEWWHKVSPHALLPHLPAAQEAPGRLQCNPHLHNACFPAVNVLEGIAARQRSLRLYVI